MPARDAAATLAATLDGLARQVRPAEEVIVVDNGSRDTTAAVAEAHPVVTTVIARRRGEGAGAARNAGVAAAAGDVLAFTDADCVPAPAWLAEGAAALARADLVQGSVTPPPDAVRRPFDRTLWVTQETGLYETANLFVRRELFDAAGGFADFVVPDGRPFGEDVAFAWRARRRGARTAFCPGAQVHHAVLPSGARQYLRERRRDGYFAHLAREVAELREQFLWRRAFLSRRSAAFDLAAAGALAAGVTRRPAPLVAVLPWLWLVREESRRRTGVPSGRVALVVAAGDAVAFGSLVRESARTRTLVI